MGSLLEGKVIENEVEIVFSEFCQLESLQSRFRIFSNGVNVVQIDNTVTCNNNNYSDKCSRDKSDVHIPLTGNYQPQVESHRNSTYYPIKVTKISSSPLSEHNTLSIPITF